MQSTYESGKTVYRQIVDMPKKVRRGNTKRFIGGENGL